MNIKPLEAPNLLDMVPYKKIPFLFNCSDVCVHLSDPDPDLLSPDDPSTSALPGGEEQDLH